MFADALMDLLTPSDCSLLMMMSGYRPSRARVANLLDIRREFTAAGLDMVYRQTTPEKLRGSDSTYVTLRLIGKDIAKIIERISDPKTFWKDRTKVEDLYIYIPVPKARRVLMVSWIQPDPSMSNEYRHLLDDNIPRGWLNVNPDLSSPLKLLTVEPHLINISQMGLTERMKRWCRTTDIIGCLMSDISSYQPILPYRYRERNQEQSTDHATLVLEAGEDKENRSCFHLMELVPRMDPPAPSRRLPLMHMITDDNDNKALGLPGMMTCSIRWSFAGYDTIRVTPSRGQLIPSQLDKYKNWSEGGSFYEEDDIMPETGIME